MYGTSSLLAIAFWGLALAKSPQTDTTPTLAFCDRYIAESALFSQKCVAENRFSTLSLPDKNPTEALLPWSYPPDCVRHTKQTSTYCVLTSRDFAAGRGISLFTTPQHAAKIAALPAFDSTVTLPTNVNNLTDPPFEARALPGRGIGLIVTRPLKRGDTIMANTPVLVIQEAVFKDLHLEDRLPYLGKAVVRLPQKSKDNFMNLCGHFGGDHVSDVIDTNSFAVDFWEEDDHDVDDEDVRNVDGGLDDDRESQNNHMMIVPEISRINHACRPNSHYVFNPVTMTHTVRALKDIEIDEEITISYIDPVQSREERMAALKRNWGFDCSCSACTGRDEPHKHKHNHTKPAEKASGNSSDERLQEIDALRLILEEWTDQNASSRATPQIAERLISLYNEENLHAPVAEAYTLAAIEFNAHGIDAEAVRYADLAIDSGILYGGEADSDVKTMRDLRRDPRGHWSWLLRDRVRDGVS